MAFLINQPRPVFAASLLAVLAGAPAQADIGDQLFNLTASDAAAGDNLGFSVAVNDTWAVVGAQNDDVVGSNSGSAYVFDVNTGEQRRKLIASDASADDKFGWSVAINGNIALIGAVFDDGAGSNSGSAYLFNVTTGQQLFKLTASDAAAGDNFGHSVALSGNLALVGAIFDDGIGSNSGSAYLFDVTTGQQLRKLTAVDEAIGDWFGVSVALSGSRALVGSQGDDDRGTASGSAYLFDVANGLQLRKLNASDGAAGDAFGVSVALSGDTALVGANAHDGAGANSGAAYLFNAANGQQLHKLSATDAAAGDSFGYAVALSGDTAIVGANGNDDAGNSSGSAYLFDVGTGGQLRKLTASDAAAGDFFGESVSISGNFGLVGARNTDDTGSDSGSAYLFDAADNQLLGDFNRDGAVNAADYVVWRKNPGGVYNQNDFNIWRAHFGQTVGAGSEWPAEDLIGTNASVPEPTSQTIVAVAIVLIVVRQQRARSHRLIWQKNAA
jgi:WD40 repeat protein